MLSDQNADAQMSCHPWQLSYLLRRQPEEQADVERVVGDPADEKPAHDVQRHLQRSLCRFPHPFLSKKLKSKIKFAIHKKV